MKLKKLSYWGSLSAIFAAASCLQAQDSPDAMNQFGFSYRVGLNISASFKNVGAFTPGGHTVPGQGFQMANPGPATGHGINRTYEDGYNWVDSTGNTLGYTRYWGYDNSSQLVGNSIVMHSTSSAGVNANGRDDDPLPGFEITYLRQIGQWKRMKYGVLAAFGYTDININDAGTISGRANRISDSYALPPNPGGGFVIPPPAPYAGPFQLSPEGNPVIADEPSRSTDTIASSVAGRRRLGADLFGFRFGPYLYIPVADKVSLNLNGGLALAYVHSDFLYSQTVVVNGTTLSTSGTGTSSHSDLLPGFFVSAQINYALSDQWSLFCSAQFMDAGNYTHHQGPQSAVLDLSQAVFVSAGVAFSF